MAKAKRTTSAEKRMTADQDKAILKRKATKAKADKVKAAAKAKLTEKANQTSAVRKLIPLAKEINTRLDRAEVAREKAHDLTLSAAIFLAEAKGVCKVAKLKFETWCAGSVTHSYSRARKLAAVGASENPALALADLREVNATEKREKRASEKSGRTSGQKTQIESVLIAPPKSAFQSALDSAAALDSKSSLNLATDIAAEKGMRVISDHDHNELLALRKAEGGRDVLSLERVQHDFDTLGAKDKMALARYAAKKVGVELVEPSFDPVKDQPEFLKRTKKKKPAATRAVTVRRGAVA